MTARLLPRLAWVVVSAVLLTVGFLGYVYVASAVAAARLDAESVRKTQTALAIYARIVLVKGLLPQILLSCGLFVVVESLAPRAVATFRRQLGVFAGLAGVVGVGVATFLLTADLENLPAVKYRGTGNYVLTILQLTGAVTAAAMATRWLMDRFGGTGSA